MTRCFQYRASRGYLKSLPVPTIRFQILYVFLVLAHERRRIVHFAVTAHPTAEWAAHQLREAFPWENAPHYLLRDRDRIFGHEFLDQVKAMGIEQVLSAPHSPWQRAHIERLIGSIRRECLDHLIVFNSEYRSSNCAPCSISLNGNSPPASAHCLRGQTLHTSSSARREKRPCFHAQTALGERQQFSFAAF
jgi:transposase InsO family protein